MCLEFLYQNWDPHAQVKVKCISIEGQRDSGQAARTDSGELRNAALVQLTDNERSN